MVVFMAHETIQFSKEQQIKIISHYHKGDAQV